MHQHYTWKGMPEDSALSLQTWILIYSLFSEMVFININMPLESYLLRLYRGTESWQSCFPSGSLLIPPLSHQGPGIRRKPADSRALSSPFFFLVFSALGFNIWFQEITALKFWYLYSTITLLKQHWAQNMVHASNDIWKWFSNWNILKGWIGSLR